MIIDSHCHLNYEPMSLAIKETIKRANNDGVKYLLTISTEDKSFNKILDIISSNKCVYGSYGIHPHEAKNHLLINSEDIIKKININKKLIGIGESGLDFYYNYSDKNDQIRCFEEHITAAQKTKIPIIVHTRNAETETYEILKNYDHRKVKILMHCFTGSIEFSQKLLSLGAFFSASGIITFKNSSLLRETFKSIPDNRILIETDSPYLAPVPMRGKNNEPSFLQHTAKELSFIKDKTIEEIVNLTTKNFNHLFNIL